MSSTCLLTHPASCSEPVEVVAIEVRNNSGQWVHGYELLSFDVDGLVTVRSTRTHAVRRLPCDQWRDPMEVAVMTSMVQKQS
jgi:hypothetical protein